MLSLLGLSPMSAQAALPDANCPGPASAGQSASSRAQTFTAVHTGTLVRGEMFVAKKAGADFRLQILNAGPSGPTGEALGTATVPDSSIPSLSTPGPTSPPSPVDGTFSPGVSVVAGQQYAILLSRPGDTFIAKDRSEADCPGNEFDETPGGSWMLINPTYDLPFSTFVNPPNGFTVGKAKGTKVTLSVPGPGAVDIAAAKKLVRSSHTDVAAAGQVKVRIPLTKRGKSLLRRKGKLKVRAAITYTPTGGEPNSVTSKLKLKRK